MQRRLVAVAPVAVGLVLIGAAAYLTLAVAARALSAQDYAAVASTYFIITIAGTGVFTAVEQETNRALSRGGREGVAGTFGAVLAVTGGLVAVVVVVVLAAGGVLVRGVLAGHGPLLAALVVGIVGAAALAVLRGAYGGTGRYPWYAATVAGEGVARLLPLAVLVLIGALTAVTLGGAFALGTGLAAAATVVGLVRVGVLPGRFPRTAVREIAHGVALLIGASTLTFFIANMAPVVVTARLLADPATAASFASAAMLTRIPLFLFFPAQAFLLPPLTRAAEDRDLDRMRRHLRWVLALVGIVGVVGVLVLGLAGGIVSSILLAAPVELSWATFAALALGTALMMVAQVLQPALVALGRHRETTIAWVLGAAVFLGLLLVPGDAVRLAATAQVAGPVVVVAVMGAALRRRQAASRR